MQVPYVLEEEAQFARQLEDKLLATPPDGGILFAGVTVEIKLSIPQLYHLGKTDIEAVPTRRPRLVAYHIYVGCARMLEEATVGLLVEQLLAADLRGAEHTIEVHRGKIRAPQQST